MPTGDGSGLPLPAPFKKPSKNLFVKQCQRLCFMVAVAVLVLGVGARAQQEPGGTTGLPNEDLNPMPTTNGTLGLFTLETGQLMQSGWSLSAYGNRFTRMPGSVVVSNYGLTVGWGFRKWMNFYTNFQPEVATQIGSPAELSLRTPPNVIQFPQYQNTIYRSLGPGQRPGYVEDFPFASRNDSGPGNVTSSGADISVPGLSGCTTATGAGVQP